MEPSPEKLRELQLLCLGRDSGRFSAEDSDRLERLLVGSPELQEAYCRWVSVDYLISAELGERVHVFPSLLIDLPNSCNATSSASSGTTASYPENLSSALATVPSSKSSKNHHGRGWMYIAVAASVVALLAMVTGQTVRFWVAKAPPRLSLDRAEDRTASSDEQQATKVRPACIVLKSHETIDMLHHVTDASWQPARVQAPKSQDESFPLDDDLSERLLRGVAQLSPFNGKAAGGYVAVLPPDALLELHVSADSRSENTLVIMELDERGCPTGQLVSFNNQSGTNSEGGSRIYGQLGSWSERNQTQENKYYLIAGLQKNSHPLATPSWFVTDFSVLVDRPDLLHIGWDDTYWTVDSASSDNTSTANHDKDFNDVSATIRIRLPDADPNEKSGIATYSTDRGGDALAFSTTADSIDPDAGDSGCPFTIEPGQGIILTVSSRATDPNTCTVIDRNTGKVWWSCTNSSRGKQHLATYVIENHDSQTLSLAIVGHHQFRNSDTNSAWLQSAYRVLTDEERCLTIGFEDSGRDYDWNDMRVNLHRISN